MLCGGHIIDMSVLCRCYVVVVVWLRRCDGGEHDVLLCGWYVVVMRLLCRCYVVGVLL